MKNIIVLIAILLVSCQAPVNNTTIVTGRHVMNSLWQEVTPEQISTAGRSLARGVVSLDANVAAYNAAHIDDQWFIVDGDIPGIDQAPLCQVYIVDKVTHVPLTIDDGVGGTIPLSYTDWPRRQLVERYTYWVDYAVSYNAELYIDVIPPAPTPPTAEQFYASHQVYIINNVGAIKYHYDCSVVPIDGWPNFTPDTYYGFWVNQGNLIIRTDGVDQPDSPWSVVNGYIYTEPVTP